jgi:hypothetical protein
MTPIEGMFERIREFWSLTECPIPRLSIRSRGSIPVLNRKEAAAYLQFVHPFPNLFDAFTITTLIHPRNLK